MSFHHPQDRHRDRKEQIRQQFHEARERMSHTDPRQAVEEAGDVGASGEESAEERKARFERDIERRLDQTGKQIRRQHERNSNSTGS